MSGIDSLYGGYGSSPIKTGSYGKVKEAKTEVKPEKAEEASVKNADKRADSFTRSESNVKNNTYTKGIKTEYTGKSSLQIKNEGMKDMVSQLLGQASNAGGKPKQGLTLESIMKNYGLDYIESDGSEDFWGAEKTANRILDFAKNLVGNDPEAFEKVKNAFEKGFGECEGIWGGKLPEVCYDTVDRVRQGFDDWEKELKGQSTSTAETAAAEQ